MSQNQVHSSGIGWFAYFVGTNSSQYTYWSIIKRNFKPVQLEVFGEPVFTKALSEAFGVKSSRGEESLGDRIFKLSNPSISRVEYLVNSHCYSIESKPTPHICGHYRITANPQLCKTPVITMELVDMHTGFLALRSFQKNIYYQRRPKQIPFNEFDKELTTINTMMDLFQCQSLLFVVNNLISDLQGVRLGCVLRQLREARSKVTSVIQSSSCEERANQCKEVYLLQFAV